MSKRTSRSRMKVQRSFRTREGPDAPKHIILTNDDSLTTGLAENCGVLWPCRLDSRLSALRQTDEGETQHLKRVTMKWVFWSDESFALQPLLMETKDGGTASEVKDLDKNANELIQGSANKAYEVKYGVSRFSKQDVNGNWMIPINWNITKYAKRWFIHNATGFAAPADASDLYAGFYVVGDASQTIYARWFLDIEYYVVEGSVELKALT